jgi:glycosyltransferase involved in cell wall biosynthesis
MKRKRNTGRGAKKNKESLRIAAFGFRFIPPREGTGGGSKFASELYSRFVEKGHQVVAYNRIYPNSKPSPVEYNGIRLINLMTTPKSGFETLFHSFKTTLHILFNNTGDVIHIHNGGNSIWSLPLRLFGKKVFVCQDGVDWQRDKWPWYGKLFLYISSFLTAYLPNRTIFDNIYAKELFEKKFNKEFDFIPYGSEVKKYTPDTGILKKLGLEPNEYFLFVGNFIPDKGLHYLVPAFERVKTVKKLVLVGAALTASPYEAEIKKTTDPRIKFPGYIYGDDIINLMNNAYAYIQPSDIEGLSPVILTVMGLGIPLICSNIKENLYIVKDTALTFEKSNIDSLVKAINFAVENPSEIKMLAQKAYLRVTEHFNWDKVTDEHIQIFSRT